MTHGFRRKTNRLNVPQPEDPKHLSATPRMQYSQIVALMTPEARKRVHEIDRLQTVVPDAMRANPSHLAPKAVAERATALNFARKVTAEDERNRPTTGWIDWMETAEVCGYEKSPTGSRARQIQWVREQNDAVRAAGYEAQLGHGHGLLCPEEYDDDVPTTEGAALRDLKISFYQRGLPKECWSSHRFRDTSGALYEFTVDAMGHVLSCERMTLISLTLGFAPGFSKVTIPGVKVRAHVDNIRGAGNKAAVQQWAKAVDTRARLVTATFGLSTQFETEYDFCGRHYVHGTAPTVSVSEKTLRKVHESAFVQSMPFEQWESCWSRVIHCASIVTTSWSEPSKWAAMHEAKRLLALASYGKIKPSDAVRAPPLVWEHWNAWRAEILLNVPRKLRSTWDAVFRYIMYTDATKKSFGGVLIDLWKNTVQSYGAAFPSPFNDINPAEVAAVNESHKKFNLEKGFGVIQVVDNSSAEAGLRNRKAVSEPVNTEVHKAVASTGDRPTVVYRVRSEHMPADEPSRNTPVDLVKVQMTTKAVLQKFRERGDGVLRGDGAG